MSHSLADIGNKIWDGKELLKFVSIVALGKGEEYEEKKKKRGCLTNTICVKAFDLLPSQASLWPVLHLPWRLYPLRFPFPLF